MSVFISYRREDTVGYAGRIYDRLIDRFGREQVYRDVDSGEPGEDFVATIRSKVEACDVLLALIGPSWLKATDDTGGWRLAQEDDLVRVEIATALERGIRVVPILLQGAEMPRARDLPAALSKLAQRNAVEIRDTHFDQDVSQLLDDLSPRWFRGRWMRPLARPVVWVVLALLLAAGVGAAYLAQVPLTPAQARGQLKRMDVPYTPDAFVEAAARKDAPAVKLFLKAGMDVDARDREGDTALEYAASNGDLPLMQSLMKAGARTERPLLWAAAAGQLDAMQLLLSKGPEKGVLDEALLAGADQAAAVGALLERGADANAADSRGETALMRAARHANVDSMKRLAAHGAVVHAARTDPAARGQTALYYLASVADSRADAAIEAATLLLGKGADLNVRAVDVNNSEGWTPLLAALREKHWKFARFLIERGADVSAQSVARSDYDERVGIGLTPLMLTARAEEVDTSKALLAKAAEVGTRTPSGRTALSFAAEGGSAPLVDELVARGARVDDATRKGWTPLMFASKPDVAAALLRHGADVDARTAGGSTALLIAAQGRSAETVSLLLAKRANPNAVNDDGWTPLMAAAYAGAAANARALVDGGARKDVRNRAGETALDIARKQNAQGVVDVLLALERSADPHPRRPVRAAGAKGG
jgi:ankyrin repeat protein